MKYIALLRGVNVGGKNKLSMAELKTCLDGLGLRNVKTYINSGNVLFKSGERADALSRKIEQALIKAFNFDSDLIKILVLSETRLESIVHNAPEGFGKTPAKHHSDVVFLIDVDTKEAFEAFELNPEVDAIWLGEGAIYFRRLSAKLTKSRLSKIVGKPVYKSMTIRNWNTVTKLLAIATES